METFSNIENFERYDFLYEDLGLDKPVIDSSDAIGKKSRYKKSSVRKNSTSLPARNFETSPAPRQQLHFEGIARSRDQLKDILHMMGEEALELSSRPLDSYEDRLRLMMVQMPNTRPR